MYKIMIADDEPILRSSIANACDWHAHGIEIIAQASNGAQVLALIDECQPHLIITDIVMPVMDGIELIQELSNRYPEIQVLVLSSFSEFNYVRECFKYGIKDYLLKPEITAEQLLQKIQNLRNLGGMFNQNISAKINYNAMLYQYLESQDMPINDIHSLKAYFSKENFILMGFSSYDIIHILDLSIYQLEKSILKICYACLSNGLFAVAFYKGKCIILLNYKQNDEDKIKLDINHFVLEIQAFANEVNVFSSDVFNNLKELKSHYIHLKCNLAKRIYYRSNAILKCIEKENTSTPTTFDMGHFLNILSQRHFNNAQIMIKTYFRDIEKNKCLDEYAIKKFTQNIVYSIINIVELNHTASELTKEKIKIFRSIDIALHIDTLLFIALDTLKKYEYEWSTTSRRQTNLLTEKICSYIDNHYMRDLNLKEIADHFHLNYSYFSSYFKSHTGKNITTYINDVRITHAKDLLLKSDDLICEIALQTGFSDHNYFSKVFKKTTGKTPNEYRKNQYTLQQNEDS